MINQVILVGRLVEKSEIKKLENGNEVLDITLAVPRTYKNLSGEYETDFIDIKVFNSVAGGTTEYCKQGDVVGVKGGVQSRIIYNLDGSKTKKMEIVADKVTFLSDRRKEGEENNE